jgi:transmembrane 9 superfamily member 2/4
MIVLFLSGMVAMIMLRTLYRDIARYNQLETEEEAQEETVFIELFFILTSIWLHQFYCIFGFLFLVFIILIVTCAEITIVLCYFQLCSEDYMWWWRSYLTSGSSAIYLFLYAGFYFFTKLQITKFVSGVLYFGYMLLASYALFVLTGTIGFCACFWFTRLIYSSVKID